MLYIKINYINFIIKIECSSKCGECETTFDKCTSCSVGIKRSFSVSEGCGCEVNYLILINFIQIYQFINYFEYY